MPPRHSVSSPRRLQHHIISLLISYDQPPSRLSLSRAARSFLTSSSVNRSAPLQLALDVLARNLCHRSLPLWNTSSMSSAAGGPNICDGSIVSWSIRARRRSGESAQAATLLPLGSSSSSSSSSVCISGSSMDSLFWKRGDDLGADLAVDLAPLYAPGRAGVLYADPGAFVFGAKGIGPLEICAMSRGCVALAWLLCCAVTVALNRSRVAL